MDWKNPLQYTALAAGLVAVVTSVISAWQGSSRRYRDRLSTVIDALRDGEPGENDGLAARWLWAESLYEFDRMTTPRRNWQVAAIAMVLSMAGSVASFSLAIMAVSLDLTIFFRGLSILSSLTFAVWSVVGAQIVNEQLTPLYRLGGTRLSVHSEHIHRIQQLRAEFVAGAADKIADKEIERLRKKRRQKA